MSPSCPHVPFCAGLGTNSDLALRNLMKRNSPIASRPFLTSVCKNLRCVQPLLVPHSNMHYYTSHNVPQFIHLQKEAQKSPRVTTTGKRAPV
ncbi:hypothetical protein L596_006628 [Steinernema carpocapsae]|uniref:Uncharacterized protein n=1 Tax=Steinernema carpocapsae TaxID=34508 RepID=A0A4U8V2N0_STECR|nr:hypothetical protein L596_006628 [Steinernema carpocapsae]